jgi:hypothetical protein
MGRMITAIFRRDLPFVYGLVNMPEAGAAEEYTDTIQEFERRAPNHYRARRKKRFRCTREDPLKKRRTDTGKTKTARKTAGAISRRITATQGRAVQHTNTT